METVASILRKASLKRRQQRQHLQKICTQAITPPASTEHSPVDTGSGIMSPPAEFFLVILVFSPFNGSASFITPSGKPADPNAVRQALGAEYFSLAMVDRFFQRADREMQNITQLPRRGLSKFPVEIHTEIYAESHPYCNVAELAQAEQRLMAEFNVMFAVFRDRPTPENLHKAQVAFASIYNVRVTLCFLLEQALDSRLQAKGTVVLVEGIVHSCGCESESTGKPVATPPSTPGLVSTWVEFNNPPEGDSATRPLILIGFPDQQSVQTMAVSS